MPSPNRDLPADPKERRKLLNRLYQRRSRARKRKKEDTQVANNDLSNRGKGLLKRKLRKVSKKQMPEPQDESFPLVVNNGRRERTAEAPPRKDQEMARPKNPFNDGDSDDLPPGQDILEKHNNDERADSAISLLLSLRWSYY